MINFYGNNAYTKLWLLVADIILLLLDIYYFFSIYYKFLNDILSAKIDKYASSVVAEKLCDAVCPSVVSFNSVNCVIPGAQAFIIVS